MSKPAVWMRTLAGAVAGTGSRVLGVAFGKAIAFTYAVIVSVVANVGFDFVRDPPRPVSTAAMMTAAVEPGEGAPPRARLPAPPSPTTAKIMPTEAAPPTMPAPPENPRPGPGSGGLY